MTAITDDSLNSPVDAFELLNALASYEEECAVARAVPSTELVAMPRALSSDELAKMQGFSNVVPIRGARAAKKSPAFGSDPKAIRHEVIKARDWVKFGKKHEGPVFEGGKAEVIPGTSIRLFGFFANTVNGGAEYDITLKVGEPAVYDSYNFDYVGTIAAIGRETVTIAVDGGSNRRLSLYDFARYNWDFSPDRSAKRQAGWRD